MAAGADVEGKVSIGAKGAMEVRADDADDAALPAAAVVDLFNVNGPRWPQAVSSVAPSHQVHATSAAFAVATLFLRCNMPWILSTMTSAFPPTPLTDADYAALAEEVLARVETCVDGWLQDDTVDIDAHRTGGLLELGFPNGSKIVLNTQPPLQELWLAARSGGFHYKFAGNAWRDTRDGSELFAVLSACASEQAGRSLTFK